MMFLVIAVGTSGRDRKNRLAEKLPALCGCSIPIIGGRYGRGWGNGGGRGAGGGGGAPGGGGWGLGVMGVGGGLFGGGGGGGNGGGEKKGGWGVGSAGSNFSCGTFRTRNADGHRGGR